jgi:Fur family transcriptional regulator, ferric uptake regulator
METFSKPIQTRSTQQRQAILNTFEQAKRPLSSAEILELSKISVAQLGIATVYRNVKTMVQEGVLQTVSLPNEAPRYELAHMHHHHHFQCRQCDKVFDVHGCLTGIDALAPKGFKVESHDITLYGACSECQ